MTKSENVPILGIFSPKTILMFRVGLKKIRVSRQQEPHIYISFKPYCTQHYNGLVVYLLYLHGVISLPDATPCDKHFF